MRLRISTLGTGKTCNRHRELHCFLYIHCVYVFIYILEVMGSPPLPEVCMYYIFDSNMYFKP
jgi:hypothetical protein